MVGNFSIINQPIVAGVLDISKTVAILFIFSRFEFHMFEYIRPGEV